MSLLQVRFGWLGYDLKGFSSRKAYGDEVAEIMGGRKQSDMHGMQDFIYSKRLL